MFLIIRGTLVIDGWRFSLNMGADRRCSAETLTSEYHGFMGAIAKSMLWYVPPLAHFVFFLLIASIQVATWFVVQFTYTFFFSSNSIAYVCLMLPSLRLRCGRVGSPKGHVCEPFMHLASRRSATMARYYPPQPLLCALPDQNDAGSRNAFENDIAWSR